MADWVAPAKLNLDLRVGPARGDGLHPLRSVVQTVEWCDVLAVNDGDEDRLVVDGDELSEGGDNLVWRALEKMGLEDRPRLELRLTKSIAVAAGLGGGSANAAAMLVAVADMCGLAATVPAEVAPRVGADVPFFLIGGTALMEGAGELISAMDPLEPFSVAIVVPPFELATSDVYRRWDEMDGPVGRTLDRHSLPPPMRRLDDVRNDLTPAAVSLRPELGDWVSEQEREWGRPVFMTGSGPACFGVFIDDDEATDALVSVAEHRAAKACTIRSGGVARRED
ncbi:4-(cytidine 5'-diphospho)-2-C-methyl-D-erythritol kinase [soil metagenome]